MADTSDASMRPCGWARGRGGGTGGGWGAAHWGDRLGGAGRGLPRHRRSLCPPGRAAQRPCAASRGWGRRPAPGCTCMQRRTAAGWRRRHAGPAAQPPCPPPGQASQQPPGCPAPAPHPSIPCIRPPKHPQRERGAHLADHLVHHQRHLGVLLEQHALRGRLAQRVPDGRDHQPQQLRHCRRGAWAGGWGVGGGARRRRHVRSGGWGAGPGGAAVGRAYENRLRAGQAAPAGWRVRVAGCESSRGIGPALHGLRAWEVSAPVSHVPSRHTRPTPGRRRRGRWWG
jgi:hypothetical protein